MYSHQLLSRVILGAVAFWMTAPPAIAQAPTHSFPPDVLQYDGSLETFQLLPEQDPDRDYVDPAMLTLANGDILLVYREWGFPTSIPQLQQEKGCDIQIAEPWNQGQALFWYEVWDEWSASEDRPPKLWLTRSSDGGNSWSDPLLIAEDRVFTGSYYNLSIVQTTDGRVLVSDSPVKALETPDSTWLAPNLFYSNDDGLTWSETTLPSLPGIDRLMGPIDGRVVRPYTDESGSVKYLTSADGITWSEGSTTIVANQDTALVFHLQGLARIDGSEYLAMLRREDLLEGESATWSARSVDGGLTWSTPEELPIGEAYSGQVRRSPGGTLWYVYQDMPLEWGLRATVGIPDSDVYYTSSNDGGREWTEPQKLTEFFGGDFFADIAFSGARPVVAFNSTRFLSTPYSNRIDGWRLPRGSRSGMIWLGILEKTREAPSILPPVVRFVSFFDGAYFLRTPVGEVIVPWAYAFDDSVVASVALHYSVEGEEPMEFTMLDNGLGMDETSGDQRWTADGIGPQSFKLVDLSATATDHDGNRSHVRGYQLQFTGHWSGAWRSGPAGLVDMTVGRVGTRTLRRPYPYVSGDLCSSGRVNPLGLLFWTDDWDTGAEIDAAAVIDGWTGIGLDSLYAGWEPGAAGPEIGPGISDFDVKLHGVLRDLGIEITYQAFQWADPERDDFIILEHTYTNSGTVGDLQNLYAGLYADVDMNLLDGRVDDILASAGDDQAGFDSQNEVIYTFDGGDFCVERGFDCLEIYLGFALLGDDLTLHTATGGGTWDQPSWVKPVERSEFQLEQLKSGTIDSEVESPPNDHVLLIAPKPFDLAADRGTKVVTYGIVAGESKEGMLANAQTMRTVHAECVLKGVCTAAEGSHEHPSQFTLHQNYPNPFNPVTTFTLDVPRPSDVSVKVFDLLGREVDTIVSETLMAGRHRYTWNASDTASGVYVYRLQAGDFVANRKLTLLR